jgi:hypothetical protein
MTADGLREDFCGQHDGGRIERGFFPPFPEPCRGGTDQRHARDAYDCGDQRSPFAVAEGGAGSIDLDAPVFLAAARQIAAVGRGDWRRRRGDVLALLQQSRLIALDLNDQLIAGLAGNLESFFDNAWRRA